MRGNGHDRARAVLGKDEVADPDRHFLSGERVDRGLSGVEAFFTAEPRFLVLRLELLHLGLEFRRVGSHLRELLDERMLGRQDDERRAVDGVDARREYFDLETWRSGDWKLQSRAF